MGGLGIWLRAEARRRWRAWLAIAVIAGVGWGAVLTAVAGARRTDTAFARFREFSNSHDVLVSPEGTGMKGFSDAIARLPEVVSSGAVAGLNVVQTDPPPPDDFVFGAPLLALDRRYGRTIDRPKLLKGRLPDPASPTEAIVSPSFVDGLGVDLGAKITMRPVTSGDPATSDDLTPVYGRSFVVTIVGIGVTQSEAFPITTFDREQPFMLLTRAAFDAYWAPTWAAFDGVAVRLRPGTDVTKFQHNVRSLQSTHPEAGGELFLANEDQRPAIVRRALRPLVAALVAFAIAVAVTLVLVVSQSVARQVALESTDYPTLRAIGMSQRRIVLGAIVPATTAALTAAGIASVVAVAASPLTPIGAARLAEPSPGVMIDLTVLLPGAAALILFLVAAAVLSARSSAAATLPGRLRTEARGSTVAESLTRAGLPPTASAGVRMALLPGRGSTLVPVRTVIISAIVSVAALSGAYSFGASLDHAVQTPRTFGQRWDADIDGQFEALFPDRLGYKSDPSFEAIAGGVYGGAPLVVNGRPVPAIGIDELKGSAFPTLLQGRKPTTTSEIVLGTSTLRRIGAKVGSSVVVTRNGTPSRMRVVGRAVLPAFGIGSFTPTGLGEGAILTADGIGRGDFLPANAYSFVLARFSPHPSPDAVRKVDHACDSIALARELCFTHRLQQPPEIETYAQVRNVSWVLVGVLGALAAATLGHGLLATVRRRRRDLAILKTLGFVRRQISSAVAWQATTFAVLALIGIPVGIVVGRWTWIALTDQLGIPAEPRAPIIAIVLTVPAAILLGNVVSALPGRAASRTQAALVLRAE